MADRRTHGPRKLSRLGEKKQDKPVKAKMSKQRVVANINKD